MSAASLRPLVQLGDAGRNHRRSSRLLCGHWEEHVTHADATISELRQESERNRAALAASALELRSRIGATATEIKTMVSPAHIKDEVKTYVRDTGNNFIDTMTERARENPLQAL